MVLPVLLVAADMVSDGAVLTNMNMLEAAASGNNAGQYNSTANVTDGEEYGGAESTTIYSLLAISAIIFFYTTVSPG